MAFLHCHNCGWVQDDFWSRDVTAYHPFRVDIVEHLRASLFQDKVYFDKSFFEGTGIEFEEDAEGAYCVGKTYVAWRLTQMAFDIANMKYKTEEEWIAVKDRAVCPSCGKRAWDID